VDPTLSVLRELLMQQPASEAERHAQARMGEMHALIEGLTTWYDDVRKLETERLAQLLRLGARVVKLLETTDKVVAFGRPRRKKES
jgi:DNA-binding transcriptional regulator GbsR (MarR family)